MISRKDNLLVRPWQQRKFEHHRRKVQSALPAIDTNPPAYRAHVAIKLKKQQKENERCRRIERDNYLLLQKMNYIMRTSRVDNVWKTPQPNLLNRIAIYNNSITPGIEDINFDLSENEQEQRSRISKCYACRHRKHHEEANIPEEKNMWPLKKDISSRIRSKSVPVQKLKPLPTIEEQETPCAKTTASKISEKPPFNMLKTPDKIRNKIKSKEPHTVMIRRGCLILSVNFPSDTMVKYQTGNIEKILMNGLCHCKNTRKPMEVC